jgi:hypothetical protein
MSNTQIVLREGEPEVPAVANPGEVVAATAPSNQGQGVRIAELGRPVQTIFLEPGQSCTVNDLISEGLLPSEAQVYVNSMQVTDPTQQVKNGDSIVAVKNFGAA